MTEESSLVCPPLCWEICAAGGRSGSEASQEILDATAQSFTSINLIKSRATNIVNVPLTTLTCTDVLTLSSSSELSAGAMHVQMSKRRSQGCTIRNKTRLYSTFSPPCLPVVRKSNCSRECCHAQLSLEKRNFVETLRASDVMLDTIYKLSS